MVQKKYLVKFERSNISKTGEAMYTKIGLHAFCMNFFQADFLSIVYGSKGKFKRKWKKQYLWNWTDHTDQMILMTIGAVNVKLLLAFQKYVKSLTKTKN